MENKDGVVSVCVFFFSFLEMADEKNQKEQLHLPPPSLAVSLFLQSQSHGIIRRIDIKGKSKVLVDYSASSITRHSSSGNNNSNDNYTITCNTYM